MESIADILGRKMVDEPDEVAALKDYIRKEFGAKASIALRGQTLLVIVSSAALANTLRLRLPKLQEIVGGQRKIMFRIG